MAQEEVETTVLREQKPDNYEVLVGALDKVRNIRGDMDIVLNSFIPKLQEASPSGSHIYARTKTADSIINKLVEKRLLNLKEPKKGLTDLVGTTIAVDGYDKLMHVRTEIESGKLGHVFEVEDMYKDPKDGYRAVHYIILAGEKGTQVPVEVQLKTNRMKAINQLSHLPYKQHKLNEKRMLELTAIANAADHGDGKAMEEFDKIMSNESEVQSSLFKYETGGGLGGHFYMDGQKVSNTPNKTGIIGKTESGKDIYGSFDHPSHKDFTTQDHQDAADMHGYLALRHEGMGNTEASQYHAGESQKHGQVGKMETGGAMKVIAQSNETLIPENGWYKWNFTDAVTSSEPKKYKPEWALIGQLLKAGAASQATEWKPILQITYKGQTFFINYNGGEFDLQVGDLKHSTITAEHISTIPTSVDYGEVTAQKLGDMIIAKMDKYLSEEPDTEGMEFNEAIGNSQLRLPSEKTFEFNFSEPTEYEKTFRYVLDLNGGSHIMKAAFPNGLYFSYRGKRFLVFDNGDGYLKVDLLKPSLYLGACAYRNRTLLNTAFMILEKCDDFVSGKNPGIPVEPKEEGDLATEGEADKLKSGSVSNKLRHKVWTAIHEAKHGHKKLEDGGDTGDGRHVTLDDENGNAITNNYANIFANGGSVAKYENGGADEVPVYPVKYKDSSKKYIDGFVRTNWSNGYGANQPKPMSYDLLSSTKQLIRAMSPLEAEKALEDKTILKEGEPEPASKPDLSPLLSLKYDNPYELNKAIEAFLDQKNSTDSNDYTVEEKRFIALYSGMGGLAKKGATGAGLLWEYFTPDPIVQKMWGLAYKHGFNGGNVMEPASGVGAFIKYANENCRVTGYEINKYSFTICKVLFPGVKMFNLPFESRFLKNNNTVKHNVEFDQANPQMDLVIGNPPYGDFSSRGAGMGEKDYTHASKYIEYFITRGLDLLVEGGLLIYIIGVEVANGGIPWLQQDMTKAKEAIIQKSELVDAYRLPNGVFERTDVVTDIIVLRRK